MPDDAEPNTSSIDDAINECTSYIKANQKSANRLSYTLQGFIIFTICGLFYIFYSKDLFSPTTSQQMTSLQIGFLIILSVLAGVILSLYRFHVLEIARTEHYKIGFLRIRIAANNTTKGFCSEVRRSLTDKAFTYELSKQSTKKVANPVPGHPTADISTALINKLIDVVDIVPKKKKPHEDKD